MTILESLLSFNQGNSCTFVNLKIPKYFYVTYY